MSKAAQPVETQIDVTTEARAVCIARDNDTFRTSIDILGGTPPTNLQGQMVYTQGVNALDVTDKIALFEAVRRFSNFCEDNDPNGEHDFGAIEQAGIRYFWKIDIYADRSCTDGCEDPTDPSQTYRVLTVMRADEY